MIQLSPAVDDKPTVKDLYAAVIERALSTANTSDYNEMAVEIVSALDKESLMPMEAEYELGGVDEDHPLYQVQHRGTMIPKPGAGQYVLQRYVTPSVRALGQR